MQRISDFYILDFYEWIKHTILSAERDSDIDIWDLLFDEKYERLLYEEANEYCSIVNEQENMSSDVDVETKLSELMSVYYESTEFHKFCNHIRHYGFKQYTIRMFADSVTGFFNCLLNEKPYIFEENDNHDMGLICPSALVDDTRYSFENRFDELRENVFHACIVEGKAIEIDFLEWLHKRNIGKEVIEKIDLMPIDVFENYVASFCKDTGNSASVGQQLIKSFKSSDPNRLLNKLKRLLPYDNEHRKRNFRYLSHRYLSDKNIYKCVILPLKADYDKFGILVTEWWEDLNNTSGDYLDIYYCFANYGESGHTLMEQLHYMPEKFRTKLPCIALWKDNMNEARCISINDLSVSDVYALIAGDGEIVEEIIAGDKIDEIVEKVNDMAEKSRNRDRPINNFYQNANGALNVQQNMVVGSNKVSISDGLNSSDSQNKEFFAQDVAEAIKLVDSSELNENQKKELKSILEKANEGVHENSEDKIVSSRERFATFIAFAGEACQKLIATITNLTTLASFFGIQPK